MDSHFADLVEFEKKKDPEHYSPDMHLLHCCVTGDHGLADYLLRQGADPRFHAKEAYGSAIQVGDTAFVVAQRFDNEQIISALMSFVEHCNRVHMQRTGSVAQKREQVQHEQVAARRRARQLPSHLVVSAISLRDHRSDHDLESAPRRRPSSVSPLIPLEPLGPAAFSSAASPPAGPGFSSSPASVAAASASSSGSSPVAGSPSESLLGRGGSLSRESLASVVSSEGGAAAMGSTRAPRVVIGSSGLKETATGSAAKDSSSAAVAAIGESGASSPADAAESSTTKHSPRQQMSVFVARPRSSGKDLRGFLNPYALARAGSSTLVESSLDKESRQPERPKELSVEERRERVLLMSDQLWGMGSLRRKPNRRAQIGRHKERAGVGRRSNPGSPAPLRPSITKGDGTRNSILFSSPKEVSGTIQDRSSRRASRRLSLELKPRSRKNTFLGGSLMLDVPRASPTGYNEVSDFLTLQGSECSSSASDSSSAELDRSTTLPPLLGEHAHTSEPEEQTLTGESDDSDTEAERDPEVCKSAEPGASSEPSENRASKPHHSSGGATSLTVSSPPQQQQKGGRGAVSSTKGSKAPILVVGNGQLPLDVKSAKNSKVAPPALLLTPTTSRPAPKTNAMEKPKSAMNAERKEKSLPTLLVTSQQRMLRRLSSKPVLLEKSQYSLNERFQRAIETMRSFNEHTPREERTKVNVELSAIAEDFISIVKIYGKIIISEFHLKKRSFHSENLGGQAGGEKFIIHGVLFKFAVDSSGLYGGDYGAAKVAGHDLKGWMSYFNAGIRDICLPLMALLDYRGYRLIAMTVLPLGPKTLVYGSNDGGNKVHNSSKILSERMQQAAKRLNLKPHVCGMNKNNLETLSSAIDIEGHYGTDGRFYLLDLARTYPPVSPRLTKGAQNSHLYSLFRSEFINKYNRALCSDAYSGFILHDPEMATHNAEIDQATKYLLEEVIPLASRQVQWVVLEAQENNTLDRTSIGEAMHRLGVNMRYLWHVLNNVRDTTSKKMIYLEMVSRLLKVNIRKRLRALSEQLQQPLEVPYRQVVLDYFNLVFGYSAASCEYWKSSICVQLMEKFGFTEFVPLYSQRSSSGDKQHPGVWLREFCVGDLKAGRVYVSGTLCILRRLNSMTGIDFSPLLINRMSGRASQCMFQKKPFDMMDILNLRERIKHSNIVARAQAACFSEKANEILRAAHGSLDDDCADAIEFLEMAVLNYKQALESNPNNKETLIGCAEARSALHKLQVSKGRSISNQTLDGSSPEVAMTAKYFLRAIECDPTDPQPLFLYAKFLMSCGRHTSAEDYFLRVLEIDPRHIQCLHAYSCFLLDVRGLEEVAHRFFYKLKMTEKY